MNDNKPVNPFIKSSLVYIIATIIGQGLSFVSIIVFTRLMDQSDYGNYSTYYAYVSIFIVFIGANLYVPLNNAYIDKKEQIYEFRKSVLSLSLLIMLGISFLAWLICCIILKRFSAFIVFFAALHSYAFFVTNYRIYSANMENDYKKKQWLLILPNLMQFLVALIFVLLMRSNTFEARIAGSTIGLMSVSSICFFEMIRYKGPFINKENWKYALAIALPSTVMSISYMLMQQCDKVMITNIRGAEETAVYSVIYYLGYAILAVDQAISPVRQAWIYKQLDKHETEKAMTIQKWYLVLFALLSTGVLTIGRIVLRILAPESYWKDEYILPFVISGCMMMAYGFYVGIIMFHKKNLLLSSCVLIAAIINIGLNALLIPTYGSVAACYTTVLAYYVLFELTRFVAQKYEKDVYSIGLFRKFFLWLILMACIFYAGKISIIVRYILYSASLILVGIYIFRNKGEIKSIIWEKEAKRNIEEET